MRNATEEFLPIFECCKAILEAKTEEEVVAIKQEFLDGLRATGAEEDVISQYEYYIDTAVDSLENGELTFDENGFLVRVENSIEEGTLVSKEDSTVEPQTTPFSGLALSLVASSIVVSLYVKKKLKKNAFQKRK